MSKGLLIVMLLMPQGELFAPTPGYTALPFTVPFMNLEQCFEKRGELLQEMNKYSNNPVKGYCVEVEDDERIIWH